MGAALYFKTENLINKILIMAAAIFIGVFLAVFGQIYQTGADSYELFLYWSLLITGFVFLNRFLPLWFFLIVLINTTLALFWNQRIQLFSGDELILIEILLIFNAACLVIYETAKRRFNQWLKGEWFTAILSIAVITLFIVPLISYIFSFRSTVNDDIFPYCVWLLFFIIYTYGFIYYFLKKNLFVISSILYSLIIYLSSFIIKAIDITSFKDFGEFLAIGFFIVLETALVTFTVVKINQHWKESEIC